LEIILERMVAQETRDDLTPKRNIKLGKKIQVRIHSHLLSSKIKDK